MWFAYLACFMSRHGFWYSTWPHCILLHASIKIYINPFLSSEIFQWIFTSYHPSGTMKTTLFWELGWTWSWPNLTTEHTLHHLTLKPQKRTFGNWSSVLLMSKYQISGLCTRNLCPGSRGAAGGTRNAKTPSTETGKKRKRENGENAKTTKTQSIP